MAQPALDHRVLRLGRLELDYHKPHVRARSLDLRGAREQAAPRFRMALAGSSWIGRGWENHDLWELSGTREKMVRGVPAMVQPSSVLLLPQILVKTMIRKRSFGNPFEGSRREERSLSAPGNLLT